MDNKLINPLAFPSVAPVTEQNGEKNLNVNNQPGGIVNINNYYPSDNSGNTAEKMMAIRRFSRQYYQLLVTDEEDVFEKDAVTIPADRALTHNYVPPEILQRCSSLTKDGQSELKTFPAIVCMKNTEYKGLTDPNQMAVYCYIKRIRPEGKIIRVDFCPIDAFLQIKMCDRKAAVFFDLTMDCDITDLNLSAWSVHKVDLFEAFDVAGITNMPQPL